MTRDGECTSIIKDPGLFTVEYIQVGLKVVSLLVLQLEFFSIWINASSHSTSMMSSK